MTKSRVEAAGPLKASASHLLHRALQKALDIYSATDSAADLTQRQFAVLAAVGADEGVTQTALVAATGIDRSTLADLVSRMIDKGLLARDRSKVDARANDVRLTEAGRSALEHAWPRAEAADAAVLALLPRSKRDAFLKALATLAEGKARAPKAAKSDRKRARAGKKMSKKARKKTHKAALPASEPAGP